MTAVQVSEFKLKVEQLTKAHHTLTRACDGIGRQLDHCHALLASALGPLAIRVKQQVAELQGTSNPLRTKLNAIATEAQQFLNRGMGPVGRSDGPAQGIEGATDT